MNRGKTKSVQVGIIMITVPILFLIASGFSHDDMFALSYFAIVVMIISGINCLVKDLHNCSLQKEKINAIRSEKALSIKEWFLIAVFFLISLFSFSYIGFYITLFFLFVGIHLFVSFRNGKLNVKKTILFSSFGMLCIYCIFGLILKTHFPSNVLLI